MSGPWETHVALGAMRCLLDFTRHHCLASQRAALIILSHSQPRLPGEGQRATGTGTANPSLPGPRSSGSPLSPWEKARTGTQLPRACSWLVASPLHTCSSHVLEGFPSSSQTAASSMGCHLSWESYSARIFRSREKYTVGLASYKLPTPGPCPPRP